jgi:hypothetical protein
VPSLVIATLLLVAGCASEQTRFSTIRITSKVSDVYQGLVMENLARTAANPWALPSFTVLNGGTASVTDKGSAALQWVAGPHKLTAGTYGPFSAERDVQDNFTFIPTFDPHRLAAMRCAYQLAVAPRAANLVECREFIRPYVQYDPRYAVFGNDPLALVPQGWLHVGCKHDVPHHDACVVAHCRHTYVWVMPEGLDGLTRFTLLILDIATLKTVPGVPAFGTPAAAAAAPSRTAPAFMTPPREDFNVLSPSSGLLLVPRP